MIEPLEKLIRLEYHKNWINLFRAIPCWTSNSSKGVECSKCYMEGLDVLRNATLRFDIGQSMEDNDERKKVAFSAISNDTVRAFQKCSDQYSSFPWSYNQTVEYWHTHGRGEDSFVSYCNDTDTNFKITTEERQEDPYIEEFSAAEVMIYLPFYLMVDLLFNITNNTKSQNITEMRKTLCSLKDFPRFVLYSQMLVECDANEQCSRDTAVSQSTSQNTRVKRVVPEVAVAVWVVIMIVVCFFFECFDWLGDLLGFGRKKRG